MRKEAKPAPPPVPTTPAPSPRQLGQMLTPAQAAQAASAYTKSTQEAEKSLAAVNNRRLTQSQRDSAGRVRSLLQQAAALRDRDISMAAQLAARAALLARDLAAGLSR